MGWSPRDLDGATVWEFSAARSAWLDFHATASDEDSPEAMSDDRLRELGIVGFA